MTSGRPPDAADRRRAGTFVPPAVSSGVSLPVCVVFVGTVLLSVVRSCRARRVRPASYVTPGRPRKRRAPPRNAPLARHGKPPSRKGTGGDLPWRAVIGTNADRAVLFPIRGSRSPAKGSAGCSPAGDHLPDGRQRRPARVEVVAMKHGRVRRQFRRAVP